jgi:hypothetical protein
MSGSGFERGTLRRTPQYAKKFLPLNMLAPSDLFMKTMNELRRDQIQGDGAANPSAEHAQAALLAKLDQLCRKPVRPPKSMQPTPEAAKSKIRRLRRKRQLLLQRSKSASPGRG